MRPTEFQNNANFRTCEAFSRTLNNHSESWLFSFELVAIGVGNKCPRVRREICTLGIRCGRAIPRAGQQVRGCHNRKKPML